MSHRVGLVLIETSPFVKNFFLHLIGNRFVLTVSTAYIIPWLQTLHTGLDEKPVPNSSATEVFLPWDFYDFYLFSK